ncbi:Gfo/Idh/MocA family oxidoreductase [Fodinicola acaciae]|uniref:Gfo/Idh/MocA family oxidoreductase n=1 Tax=Fodinicola acaciae TaxID=2681555 RepID=UPI0013D70F73|nr:Gfo/Idh/MocA family oxidoreductase [Fodinicola acaciae]
MTDSSPVSFRVGLIGFGLAGSVFHAPLISATPGLELTAVVTGNPERADRACRDYHDVEIVRTAEELFSRPDRLDLVVIASPNGSHATLGMAALEAGLPVVIDKPMATTPQAARELVTAATERGLLLTVFQNRRWDSDFLTLRKLLDEGALGTVHRCESRFERWRPKPSDGWRDQAGPDQAAGILFDLGSHLIDQAIQLFGPVHSAYAEVDRRRSGSKADDDAFLAITHQSGTRSHLWMSSLAGQLGPRFRVLGDQAAYVKTGLDPQESDLRGGRHPARPGWGEDPVAQWGQLGTEDKLTTIPSVPGTYPEFYRQVRDALRGAAPAPVDPNDAVTVLEVIAAAREASGID